jgi:predicted nucleotidyltransferase
MSEPRDALPEVPASLHEPFRTALVAASEGWIADLGNRLVSIVLCGSVARRQARPTSDIDLVLVAHELPRALVERRRLFLESGERVRRMRALPHIQWNLGPFLAGAGRGHR